MNNYEKTHRADLDALYEDLQAAESHVAFLKDQIREKMLEFNPETEYIATFSYVKPSQIFDREKMGLLAIKHNIVIPTYPKVEKDWGKLAGLLDQAGEKDFYKERQGYPKGVKQ